MSQLYHLWKGVFMVNGLGWDFGCPVPPPPAPLPPPKHDSFGDLLAVWFDKHFYWQNGEAQSEPGPPKPRQGCAVLRPVEGGEWLHPCVPESPMSGRVFFQIIFVPRYGFLYYVLLPVFLYLTLWISLYVPTYIHVYMCVYTHTHVPSFGSVKSSPRTVRRGGYRVVPSEHL